MNVKQLILRAVGIGAASLCLVALTVCTVYKCTRAEDDGIPTVGVEQVTVEKSITGTGYLFRDEACITLSGSHVTDALFPSGEKVTEGTLLGYAYAVSDRDTAEKLARELVKIDAEIAFFDECRDTSGLTVSDTGTLRTAWESAYRGATDARDRGDLATAEKYRKEYEIAYTRYRLLAGLITPDTTQREQLLRERAALLAGEGTEVYAPAGGYWYAAAFCDGYETVRTVSALFSGKFEEVISAEPADTAGTVGKLATGYLWYLAVPVSKERAEGLQTGKTYTLTVSVRDAAGAVSARVVSASLDTVRVGASETLLVFSCGIVPRDADILREGDVTVKTGTECVYRIPASALAEDGETVYVLRDGIPEARRVSVIDRVGEYFTAVRAQDTEDASGYLGADEILIYDGGKRYGNANNESGQP